VLNAPATGEALAELIVDGAASTTDLRPFDPGRLRPLNSQTLG
jgi:glycine/D-amino acid oxidase-like deaminating enzyme